MKQSIFNIYYGKSLNDREKNEREIKWIVMNMRRSATKERREIYIYTQTQPNK